LPFVQGSLAEDIEGILRATARALRDEGIVYRGVLYAGLMLTEEGPKVLEFNCRFGDPETQVILPRLRSDLGPVLMACAEGRLDGRGLEWSDRACVCLVAASAGYPAATRTGQPIDGLPEASSMDDVVVFHAGTARRDGRVVTAGGRVLAVTALGSNLEQARDRAYEAVEEISFEGMHVRRDIAAGVPQGVAG
jgi:phosphoribosylamine--glycine ligase